MTTDIDFITVDRPASGDSWTALDALQSLWPRLRYLQAAPGDLQFAVKVALSYRLWNELSKLKVQSGDSPVDRVNKTLFGVEVELRDWRLDRIELVIPSPVTVRE